MLWRTTLDAEDALALHRCLRPYARKVDQGLFLVLCFGLMGATHRFLGILPELGGLRHDTSPAADPLLRILLPFTAEV